MDKELGGAFFQDGSDLDKFLKEFQLDVAVFLSTLRTAKAIASGVPLVHFMAGGWKQHLSSDTRKALVLDILCEGPKSAAAIRAFLEGASYERDDKGSCCHHWGEWHSCPWDKRFCMSKGAFKQLAVHIIVLRQSPILTVVSRVYGSMVGVYLNGRGSVVSLFPSLTFLERKCWIPRWYEGKNRSLVATKYYGWKMMKDADSTGKEIAGLNRRVNDTLCWKLSFDPKDGSFLRAVYPNGQGTVVMELKSPSSIEVARKFPTLQASMNQNGELFDNTYWIWEKKK